MFETFLQDSRHACRAFLKEPGFTAIVVLTLGIGIGVCSTIFSVVEAVLLRSLPYAHADRVIMLSNSYFPSGLTDAAVAAPEYFDLKEQLRAFDEVSAVRPRRLALVGSGQPELFSVYMMTPNMFDLLGTAPALGRGFTLDDGRAAGNPVVLLSHALWVRRFGADPNIVGKVINFGGILRTVLGVMPVEVRFPDSPVGFLREPGDAWIPADFEEVRADSRGNQNLAVFARVRTTATPEQAAADLATVAARFRQAYPNRYSPPRVPNWKIGAIGLRDRMVGEVRPALMVITVLVGFVLFIACVNVANLLLARSTSRKRDYAVRLALGANRWRLVRQVLTESMMISLAGALLGVGIAWAGVQGLTRFDAGYIPRLDQTRVDVTVLGFTLAISIITALMIGALPALQQSGLHLSRTLSETSRSAGVSRQRRYLRAALVAAQVALAVVVLITAGLLARSFAALQRVELGFNGSDVLSARITLPRTTYDSGPKVAAFFDQLQQQIARLPGADSASIVYPLALSDDKWSGTYSVEGVPDGPGNQLPHAEYNVAAPDYFQTMRIPFVAGREFSPFDRDGATRVVIVDELLAKQQWPNESALGKRINAGDRTGNWATVIGVVSHVRRDGPQELGEPQIYLPHLQRPELTMSLIVRTSADAAGTLSGIRAAIDQLDPTLPLANVRTIDDLVTRAVSRQRFNTWIITLFAITALGLASVGLYGVMSYVVGQRTQEIGIRMALGGRPGDVSRLVIRECMLIAVSGLIIGCGLSLALSGVLSGLLYGIAPTDALTYGVAVLVLLLVTAAASYIPVRRATRIDPVIALRCE